MAFAQNINYTHVQSQHRKLTNKSMCLNNITAILYFINYVRGLLVNGLPFFPERGRSACKEKTIVHGVFVLIEAPGPLGKAVVPSQLL